jgi:serpin B
MTAIPLRRLAATTLALGLAAGPVLSACGGDDATSGAGDDQGAESGGDRSGSGSGSGDGTSDPDTVRADLARVNAPGDAPVDQVVAGLRDVAVRLAAGADAGDDVVVSPASIAVTFAMAEAGAGDATAADIAEVFGFPDQPAVHEAMNALTAQLDAANHEGNDSGSEGVTLELANAVWGQSGVELGAPFLDTLATQYGAGVETVDFSGDPEGSRDTINGWVADVTRDRIPQLLDQVDPATVVALVNAVYLKASWQTPFEEQATTDLPFSIAPGQTVDLPTMRASGLQTEASTGDGYSAVKLPYDGNELSMVVVVPDEGTALADFESGLTGERLAGIVDGLAPAAVDLALPRFEAETALDLGAPLTAMGLAVPGGDLSGVTPGAAIDQAVHAANITVDEKGTEAAAATAMMGVTSMPTDVLQIDVDRPFLFLVQHEATGAPLFYGRILDPRP